MACGVVGKKPRLGRRPSENNKAHACRSGLNRLGSRSQLQSILFSDAREALAVHCQWRATADGHDEAGEAVTFSAQ